MTTSIDANSLALFPVLPETDSIFRYEPDKHRAQCNAKPWAKDPQFFKRIKISALALLKMVMHARTGGNIEVMGMLRGKIEGDCMIILDSFSLPVEGTETRVNAANDANEYLIANLDQLQALGRKENALGWYHSHPGYGCWLSGIDVSTQMLYQEYQEPFVAIVIDPVRTAAAGKVEIGAFRSYPKTYKPASAKSSGFQHVPLSKVEDFGVHAEQYYSLPVSFFQSATDAGVCALLWNRYWASTVSANHVTANRQFLTERISDVADKLGASERKVTSCQRSAGSQGGPLAPIVAESNQVASEAVYGMYTQIAKHMLFNTDLASES